MIKYALVSLIMCTQTLLNVVRMNLRPNKIDQTNKKHVIATL